MIAEEHLWETANGDLVPTGHPDAETLKYAAGDEIPESEAKALKQAKAPANKKAGTPRNKAQTPPDDK